MKYTEMQKGTDIQRNESRQSQKEKKRTREKTEKIGKKARNTL